jgi:ribosomal protein L21E
VRRFSKGDRVKIDIPDQTDPDFRRLHDEIGKVVGVLEDDAGVETGDERDSILYRVSLAKSDAVVDVRWRDLRPI